ncbi:MAG: hypothetical protein M1608_07585 [Candidatus Omnitrophica bacterium]|nr:hypothetical protein [Candidatus Omnitrophota bacterium]
MPRFSVWGTRLALLYFLAGFTIGALILINKAAPLHPAIWSLLPLHIEFLLMGWIVQLVFAVGYWIFPRFKFEPKRGRPGFAWVALGLLNAGIGSLTLASVSGQPAWVLIGRVLEVGAVVVFAAQLWLRAKPTETGVKV